MGQKLADPSLAVSHCCHAVIDLIHAEFQIRNAQSRLRSDLVRRLEEQAEALNDITRAVAAIAFDLGKRRDRRAAALVEKYGTPHATQE